MNTNNSFLQAIKILIKESINSAPYNRTKQAMIVSNNGDNTYDIRFDGKLYTNIISYPNTRSLPLKHIVKVIIPNNQASQMYISAEGSPLIYYPVGSYYETSDTSFDPNVTWGGTWSSETITDDVIVEEGTSGIWTYRKWSNGIAECWGKFERNVSLSANSHVAIGGSLPTFFVGETPIATGSGGGNANPRAFLAYTNVDGSSGAYYIDCYIRNDSSYASASQWAYFYVKGRWKAYTAPTAVYRWHRTA